MSFLRRQPKGTPTGGQFATTGRGESGTTLTAVPVTSWQPAALEQGVHRALDTLHTNVDPTDATFPAPEHAAAVDALHGLADALLERRGVPRVSARANDELVDLRATIAEKVATEDWSERKRDLVMSAIGDVSLARKADRLARITPGRYDIHAVHYLMALEKARREATQ